MVGGLGRLQVLTDERLQSRFSHSEVAGLALEGGADVIQYREKRLRTTQELTETARRFGALCHRFGATLIVNDRADVAKSANAAGVHLGRHDLDVATARAILGPTALIGGTDNDPAEARRVAAGGVDYLGVGPVYGTESKADPALPLGLAALREICAASPVPVIAIGNLTPERIVEVVESGAYGVAVLSGVTCQRDPAAAARRFRQALDAALTALVT